MTTASHKFQNLRHPKAAVGLFSAAFAVLLIAAQCSSSEDSLDEVVSSTTIAGTTVDAATTTRAEATTTTEVDVTATAEVDSSTTSRPETSPPVADTGDPEDAETEEQVEVPEEPAAEAEEQVEVPEELNSTISITTMPRSSETGSEESDSSNIPSSQTSGISLSSFAGCDALLDYMRGEALERVGPYGFASDGVVRPFFDRSEGIVADDLPEAEGVPAWPSLDMGTGPPPPPHADIGPLEGVTSGMIPGVDFSGTNVQVEGVDEADIVKTDGRRIIGLDRNQPRYRFSNSVIWVADTTPTLLGSLSLSDGYYSEFYLAGDRVFVIGRSTVGIDPPGGSGTSERTARAVVITEVDISDPYNPQVVRHLRVEGSYVSSRAANGYARVVISSPHGLGFVRPLYGPISSSSEDSAERFNKLIVQESTPEQWLPNYNLHSATGETISRGQLIDCDQVFAPSEFSSFNQVSVLSFATGESLELRDAVSTMADGETVYASPSNLYVSRVVYDYDADSNRRKAETVIHKFSLDSSGSADYEASGTAIGSPINQYAFHEYDGRLFVATTSGRRDSESFVTVLEDEGGALRQVGQVGDLGRNEDIYAVRYIADKAYVVTFRQTDPLYVIDLSDPTNPTTEGELKITGYSAYLHPVGEDLLLGVGREATTTGRVTGVKVSLFDVSDPSDPRTLHSLVPEGGYGYSEVEWDARAFLWWEPKKLAVVPIYIWRNDYYGALVLRVNTDADSPEIELISRVSHGPAPRPTGDTAGCEWYDVPSASLEWTAQSLSTMSVVKVCPASSGNGTVDIGVPYRYACSQLLKPGIEDQEDSPPATLDEIVEEVRVANRENGTGDLSDLLSKLRSSSVEEADQVSVCVIEYFSHNSSKEILRSIVIENNLYTLSGEYLQANYLVTLRPYGRLWLESLGAVQSPDSETTEMETDSGISGSAAAQGTGASLSSFDECNALMDFIHEEALKLVGPYGIDKRNRSYYSEVSFYDTNGPVEDPDEADIVKTDGRRIVGIDNFDLRSELWVVEASVVPRKITGRLLLSNGFYQKLYLAGDRVFALGRSGVGIDPPEGEGVIPERTADGDLVRPDAWMDSDAVVITEVDISDPENPEAVRHLRVEGRYVGSRMAGGFVRLVIDSPRERLSFVKPRLDLPRSGDSVALAERFNRQLVRESTLDQWLPNYNLYSADGESINRGRLMDCDKVYVPNKVSSFDQMSVLSFALDQDLGLSDAVSFLTDEENVHFLPDDRYVGKVYVSPSNLYAGRAVYDGGDGLEDGEPATVIHKFSLNSSGRAGYEASGKIYGHPSYNAFYEYDGRLFAVTSSSDEEDPESFMTVLEQEGETLNQASQAGDIGRGEQVESMRYFVDRAYVKTTREGDPIYVIDLSDPTNPIAKGELDISANSPYLKLVDENLLLAVGYETSEWGRSGILKASLFDVSDPANPSTLETLVLGDLFLNRDAFSSFLWWAPEKILFVPIGIREGDHLVALRVNIDADSPKIEFISRVFHDVYFRPEGDTGGCEWYEVPSASLMWTAEYLSTMAVVSVCPHNPDGNYPDNEPRFYDCQAGIPQNATLDEIVEEVRLATKRSGSEDLIDLLVRLLSSSVKDANQVTICPISDWHLGSLKRQREISHSMVVNDNLWTLSRGYLQANDLEFFDRIAWLEMPSKPDRW